MEQVESNHKGGGECKAATILILWALVILFTLLSLACTWAYNKQYDTSETAYSGVAAILTSIAVCGATLGVCGCGTGGSQAKMGMGFLWQCFHNCDGEEDICLCFRGLALCGLLLIIVPSFGIFQVTSGGLIVQSLVINTATNVKVFAGFIAVFDFIATICGFICACLLCTVCTAEFDN